MYNQVSTPAVNIAEASKAGRGPVVKPPRRPRQAILLREAEREQRQRPWLAAYLRGEYSI